MSGHDIVLLKSLEHRLQSSEYQLMPHLLKCLLSLISKMQMKHLSKKNSLEVSVVIILYFYSYLNDYIIY